MLFVNDTVEFGVRYLVQLFVYFEFQIVIIQTLVSAGATAVRGQLIADHGRYAHAILDHVYLIVHRLAIVLINIAPFAKVLIRKSILFLILLLLATSSIFIWLLITLPCISRRSIRLTRSRTFFRLFHLFTALSTLLEVGVHFGRLYTFASLLLLIQCIHILQTVVANRRYLIHRDLIDQLVRWASGRLSGEHLLDGRRLHRLLGGLQILILVHILIIRNRFVVGLLLAL